MKIIPFNPSLSSRQELNCNLGELVCDFRISWNTRVGAWFCDFVTTTGSNVSIMLVKRSPLLGKSNMTGLNGDFRVLKLSKMASEEITYDNFGSDWMLVYGTNDEWEEFDGGVQP